MIVKNNEFTGYLENLLQEARTLNPLEGELGKAWFQGAVKGLLRCDEEHTFNGRQVVQIINAVLNTKAPGMRVPRGEDNDKNNSSNVNSK